MINPARAQGSLRTPPPLDGSRDGAGHPRLVALEEGSDIPLDRPMVVVGRHPQCDTRLDSIRVSRRHCCLNPDGEGIVVRDLGSTNGIRINGRRVEMGRLRPGDELSIAHIRYRLVDGASHEPTLADPPSDNSSRPLSESRTTQGHSGAPEDGRAAEDAVAAAVRGLIPSDLVDRYRIQVIVRREHGPGAADPGEEPSDACRPDSSP